jgi:hypothetical protein
VRVQGRSQKGRARLEIALQSRNLINHAQGSDLSNEESVYVTILFQNQLSYRKEEADMLLRLPNVVLATLSPVAVSHAVPK